MELRHQEGLEDGRPEIWGFSSLLTVLVVRSQPQKRIWITQNVRGAKGVTCTGEWPLSCVVFTHLSPCSETTPPAPPLLASILYVAANRGPAIICTALPFDVTPSTVPRHSPDPSLGRPSHLLPSWAFCFCYLWPACRLPSFSLVAMLLSSCLFRDWPKCHLQAERAFCLTI